MFSLLVGDGGEELQMSSAQNDNAGVQSGKGREEMTDGEAGPKRSTVDGGLQC